MQRFNGVVLLRCTFNTIKLWGMMKGRKSLVRPRKKPLRNWRSTLYIRQHRESRGISLTALAKAIGKSKGLVSQIEHGRSAASPETLEDLAAYFKLAHVGMLFEPPVPKGWRRITSIVPDDVSRH